MVVVADTCQPRSGSPASALFSLPASWEEEELEGGKEGNGDDDNDEKSGDDEEQGLTNQLPVFCACQCKPHIVSSPTGTLSITDRTLFFFKI